MVVLLLHRKPSLLHYVTVSERDRPCLRATPPVDRLQCQSAYQPVNSSLVDFQPASGHSISFVPSRSPSASAGEPSDLCQRYLVAVRVALDVEDEGVFVGVVLDDVIVHVHQDPDKKNTEEEECFARA